MLCQTEYISKRILYIRIYYSIHSFSLLNYYYVVCDIKWYWLVIEYVSCNLTPPGHQSLSLWAKRAAWTFCLRSSFAVYRQVNLIWVWNSIMISEVSVFLWNSCFKFPTCSRPVFESVLSDLMGQVPGFKLLSSDFWYHICSLSSNTFMAQMNLPESVSMTLNVWFIKCIYVFLLSAFLLYSYNFKLRHWKSTPDILL